jgi:hypothetical protein
LVLAAGCDCAVPCCICLFAAFLDQMLDRTQHHQTVKNADTRPAMNPTPAEIENGMPAA